MSTSMSEQYHQMTEQEQANFIESMLRPPLSNYRYIVVKGGMGTSEVYYMDNNVVIRFITAIGWPLTEEDNRLMQDVRQAGNAGMNLVL